MQPLLKLAIPTGSDVFYNEDFRIVLENHLQYFRNLSSSTTIKVENEDSYRWHGDFYGLLTFLNIKPYMHWFIMRLNGLESSTDFQSIIGGVLIPEASEIERLRQLFVTTHPNV